MKRSPDDRRLSLMRETRTTRKPPQFQGFGCLDAFVTKDDALAVGIVISFESVLPLSENLFVLYMCIPGGFHNSCEERSTTTLHFDSSSKGHPGIIALEIQSSHLSMTHLLRLTISHICTPHSLPPPMPYNQHFVVARSAVPRVSPNSWYLHFERR